MRDPIGIDLGTTNSAVAISRPEGRLEIVKSLSGADITPSVVYFASNTDVIVGELAKESAASDPTNAVALIKRQMGKDFPIAIQGQVHTPESISAVILRYLISPISPSLVAGIPAVITVPAYFGIAEREATRQAGLIAGIDVLELVAEPVAAAASYGLMTRKETTVLVYDLGGGTFDTTVLRIGANEVAVLATDGHHEIGGADVDRRLLNLVLDRAARHYSQGEVEELQEDERFLGGLLLEIESVKRDLSSRTQREVVFRGLSSTVRVSVSREDLEDCCRDLFNTTGAIVRRVLESAEKRGASKIDEVIMVGGSSRIPAAFAELKSLTNLTPRLVEPDLAVAKGAALRAHQIQGSAGGQTHRVGGLSTGSMRTVIPRSIGILVEDSFDPEGERSFVEHLVHANSQLPITVVTAQFGTIIDQQESVRIRVYEQAGSLESPSVDHNRLVLDGELVGLPALPAGSVIEVEIQVAIDGELTLVAREPLSGKELRLEAFLEGVIDSGDKERLTKLVTALSVRG